VLDSVNEGRCGNEIHIEEYVRAKAAISNQRMLDFAAAEKAGKIQLGD